MQNNNSYIYSSTNFQEKLCLSLLQITACNPYNVRRPARFNTQSVVKRQVVVLCTKNWMQRRVRSLKEWPVLWLVSACSKDCKWHLFNLGKVLLCVCTICVFVCALYRSSSQRSTSICLLWFSNSMWVIMWRFKVLQYPTD